MIRPLYRDPFNPVLLSADSKPLAPSAEQLSYIRAVLDIASSDSRFAQKAYDAIQLILLSGQAKIPVITSLTPGSANIGDPSFVLHVHGTDLVQGSVINFAGFDEPTTHVSDTELTTGVDMSVWLGADVLPVVVTSPNGTISEPVSFVFEAPVALASVASHSAAPTSVPVSHAAPADLSTNKGAFAKFGNKDK